jgi:hypothetical protein
MSFEAASAGGSSLVGFGSDLDLLETGSFQDFKRYTRGLFGIKEPDIAPPQKERDPGPTHIEPEIRMAIEDYKARMARRRGREATRVTMPSSLMEPVTKRPELKHLVG